MFGSYKVKIEGELLDRVKRCVEAGGYESVDEFVVRVLEKEVKKLLPPEEGSSPSREALKKRLQGLGYID
jgi:Arc/MetJ-type ribon-helix-helix transcriptional regulator